MSIVISTDHTRSMFGLYGQTTALVLCWVACDGCKVRITNLRIGGSEWDTATVVAEADANGCRWTVDGCTTRPYCPICQRRRAPGRFGWSAGKRWNIGPASLSFVRGPRSPNGRTGKRGVRFRNDMSCL